MRYAAGQDGAVDAALEHLRSVPRVRAEERLGISFAAAVQTASFARVEGRNYSSVMVTGNIRYAVETLFAGSVGTRDPAALRQARVLLTVCLTFAAGAALGAVLTTQLASTALVVPIALLLAALVLCRGA